MDTNKTNVDVPAILVKGLTALWKGYKQANRRRFETPGQTFMNELFGIEANDTQAAMCLLNDAGEVVTGIRKGITKAKFEKIIENSY